MATDNIFHSILWSNYHFCCGHYHFWFDTRRIKSRILVHILQNDVSVFSKMLIKKKVWNGSLSMFFNFLVPHLTVVLFLATLAILSFNFFYCIVTTPDLYLVFRFSSEPATIWERLAMIWASSLTILTMMWLRIMTRSDWNWLKL